MAQVTSNDDIFGDSETERYGELGRTESHLTRARMQQQKEREQEEADKQEEFRKENRRRQSVGMAPLNTESPFGRGSDVDRLAQQVADENEQFEKEERARRRQRLAR